MLGLAIRCHPSSGSGRPSVPRFLVESSPAGWPSFTGGPVGTFHRVGTGLDAYTLSDTLARTKAHLHLMRLSPRNHWCRTPPAGL